MGKGKLFKTFTVGGLSFDVGVKSRDMIKKDLLDRRKTSETNNFPSIGVRQDAFVDNFAGSIFDTPEFDVFKERALPVIKQIFKKKKK